MSQQEYRYDDDLSDTMSGGGPVKGRGKGRPPSKRGPPPSTRGGTAQGRGGNNPTRGSTSAGKNTPPMDEVMDEIFINTPQRQQGRDTTPPPTNMAGNTGGTPHPPPPQVTERSKRTVDERSPATEANVRSVRQRLNEFDLGAAFGQIEDQLKVSIREVINGTPDQLKECMTKGMEALVKGMHQVMNSVSDSIQTERLAREAAELSMEDKMERMQAKIDDLQATADSLTRNRVRVRTRESIRDMERSVVEAQSALKLLEVDIGRETEDRREIVRKTIDEVRHYVREDDLRFFDRVMRRTRVVILGKRTVRWESGGEEHFSVPTLFQCRDQRDLEELEGMLRSAGYFPTFHWPKEMVEFVGKVRDQLRDQGVRHDSHFVKVRPEHRNGKLLIKAEVKPKVGNGRFVLKGLWPCPPKDRAFWDDVPNMFSSVLENRYYSG